MKPPRGQAGGCTRMLFSRGGPGTAGTSRGQASAAHRRQPRSPPAARSRCRFPGGWIGGAGCQTRAEPQGLLRPPVRAPVPPQQPLAKREACLAPGSPTRSAWGAGAGCSRRARAVKFGGPQVPAGSRVLGTMCCLHLLLLPALLPACLSRGWHCVGGTSRLVGTLPW